jgi:hypothetical protein
MIPAPATEGFCDFMLNSFYIRLTPARKILVQDIRTAAINQTVVTQTDWYNFLLSSHNHYQDYLLNQAFFTP